MEGWYGASGWEDTDSMMDLSTHVVRELVVELGRRRVVYMLIDMGDLWCWWGMDDKGGGGR